MPKKIKVAMVAPPFGDWGGPEVVVQNLVDELIKRDDVEVTLFAPGDWKIKAKHVVTLKQSLWNMKDFKEQTKFTRQSLLLYSQLKVLDFQDEFDLIHLHLEKCIYPIGMMAHKPCVFTLHNLIEKDFYSQIKEAKVKIVFLTKTQKNNYEGTAVINNGVPVEKIKYSLEKGKYFIAIGRLVPRKGIDLAIKIAKQANVKLLIFGRINKAQIDYYNKKIKPFIDGNKIIYMKEVSHEKIYDYIRGAKALLFSIAEQDICPMSVIESLSCGTPIIGTKIDPLPELLDKEKEISFLSNDVNKIVDAVKRVDTLFDRQKCRDYAENNFSSNRMVDAYVKVYEKILNMDK